MARTRHWFARKGSDLLLAACLLVGGIVVTLFALSFMVRHETLPQQDLPSTTITVQGEFVSYHETDFTFRDDSGVVQRYKMAANGRVTLNGEHSALAELQPGDQLTISRESDQENVTSLVVATRSKN